MMTLPLGMPPAITFLAVGLSTLFTVDHSRFQANITLLLCFFHGVGMSNIHTTELCKANKLYQEGSHPLKAFPVHSMPGNHG